MTPRDNALIALKGGIPESVPCYYASCQIVISQLYQETPPKSQNEGYDGYGVHQTKTEGSGGMFTPTPGKPYVLTDITKWKEQVTFPEFESFDWEKAAKEDRERLHLDPERYVQDMFCSNGLFERLHFLMGFEEALCAIMEEPEAVSDLVTEIANTKIKFIEKAAKYYTLDYFTILDDYAHKNGLFLSPNTFREIFKPQLKRLVECVQDHGIIYKQHCCGKMDALLDDFLELGITAFDPIQPVNDVASMKKKTLGKAGLIGGLDVQNIIDREGVTEAQIRTEVRRCIDEYGPGGGYMIYGSSLHMYNKDSYKPDGVIGIIMDECESYGKNYYQ